MAFIELLDGLLMKYPELEAMDSSLHQRTIKLKESLTAQGKTGNFSLDSLMEIHGFLLELTQDVFKTITESKEDVWKNEDLRPLVNVYFDTTANTLDLLNTVEKCVGKAQDSQLIIQVAVKQFETESMETGGIEGNNKKMKYAKTLEELDEFKANGDPFGDHFMTHYDSAFKQHALLMDDYCKYKENLYNKPEEATKRRNFKAIVIDVSKGVVSKVIPLPSPSSSPIRAERKQGSKKLKGDKKAEKTQKDSVLMTEKKTKINNEAAETINILVEKLRERISSILENTDYAAEGDEEEDTTKLVMQEIMENVKVFTEKIKEVRESVAEHSKLIVERREVVLQQVTNSK